MMGGVSGGVSGEEGVGGEARKAPEDGVDGEIALVFFSSGFCLPVSTFFSHRIQSESCNWDF
jgi:hypothetical protein